MRKLIYHIAVSLDGFIADKNGNVGDFLMEGPHVDDFAQALTTYDTVVMGRSTYEFGFQFGIQPGQPAYAGLQHLIVSRSLNFESNEEVKLIKSDIAPYLQQLKTKPGKDIWLCGGGKLAGHLLNHQLIDELWLKINPMILGAGITLFEGIKKSLVLSTQECWQKKYKNGVLLQKWQL
ncbi:MAG TPA: deaminase [Microscillaceae bacterium]|nr:deaminase [Microscillaceae bacterium]